jgi:hypothetical protein
MYNDHRLISPRCVIALSDTLAINNCIAIYYNTVGKTYLLLSGTLIFS